MQKHFFLGNIHGLLGMGAGWTSGHILQVRICGFTEICPKEFFTKVYYGAGHMTRG